MCVSKIRQGYDPRIILMCICVVVWRQSCLASAATERDGSSPATTAQEIYIYIYHLNRVRQDGFFKWNKPWGSPPSLQKACVAPSLPSGWITSKYFPLYEDRNRHTAEEEAAPERETTKDMLMTSPGYTWRISPSQWLRKPRKHVLKVFSAVN